MPADFNILSVKMAISLIIILVLVISLFFLLKRLRIGPLSHNRMPMMRLLGTLSLAPKRAIALVEVCDQWLIVGIGTDSVTLISRLDPPTETDVPRTGVEARGHKFSHFLENIGLRQAVPRGRETSGNAEE